MSFNLFRSVLAAAVAVPALLVAGPAPEPAAVPDTAATATEGPLPEVAPFDPATVDLADFSGREQTIAAYLELLPDVANGVVDDDSDLRGFIDCDCWRVGVDEPTNARVQENALTMAYFYSADRPWNPYYGDPALKVRLEAALQYWLGLQTPEGAFPELPNDPLSRPGTAFSLDFLGRTLLDVLDVGPGIEPALRADVETALLDAAWWFLTDETQVWSPFGEMFANQLAAGLTAISGLVHRFDDPDLTAAFRDRVDDLAERTQSPAGHYYEAAGVGHRYSVQVMSKDLVHWADDETWPVILDMQERYVDWLQYQLLPDPDGSYFVNTALDSRHSRWNQESFVNLGANNAWSEDIAAATAFGESAEDVSVRRQAWSDGGWEESVAPVVEDRRTLVDPVLIRDLLAEEHYPTAAEKAAATDDLRPRADDGYTAWSESPMIDQQFLYAQRDGLLAGMAWGAQPNFPPGRPVDGSVWDLPRFGRQYLWHRDTGMIVQSHNAPRAGGPAAVGLDDELVWSTVDPDTTMVDAHLDHDVEFVQDGASVDHPADRSTGTISAITHSIDGTGPVTTTTVDDSRLTVTVDGAGLGAAAVERIPLALRDDDQLQWLDGDDVLVGEPSTDDAATGLLIGRGAYAVEITWDGEREASFRPTDVAFPETPARSTDPDVVGALHVLDIGVGSGVEYEIRVVADACIGSDESPAVVIGGHDSGVPNRDRGDGCTVLDLLAPGEPWPSRAAFVRRVGAVLRDLVADDVLTTREARDVRLAALASSIGTDRVQVSVDADVVAGENVALVVDAPELAAGQAVGRCLAAQVAVPAGGGTVDVAVPATALPGPCELTVTSTLTDGGSEVDTVKAEVIPGADGTVFRDDFDSPTGSAAWTAIDGRWAVDGGAYVQSDRARTGFHSVIRDLEVADGWIATDIDIVDDGGDPTNWAGVQFRATEPGDAYTESGYLAFVRQTGDVYVFRAGTGVIARSEPTGTAPSRLRVEFEGSDIAVYVDDEDEPRVAVSDDAYASGSAGLITGRTHTRFDDVHVGVR